MADRLDVVARMAREFLRTVSGLTAPMFIRGRPRSHETRTAKAPLAGLRASLPAPGVEDLDQAVETAGASTVLRFGTDRAGHASSIQVNGVREGSGAPG